MYGDYRQKESQGWLLLLLTRVAGIHEVRGGQLRVSSAMRTEILGYRTYGLPFRVLGLAQPPVLDGVVNNLMPFPIPKEPKVITVVPYDESWSAQFREIRDELRKALGSQPHSTSHVGSTSVPGLSAKPIVDVMIEVPEAKVQDGDIANVLSNLGFLPISISASDIRRIFYRSASSGRFNLHLVPESSVLARRMLLFRDWLRANQSTAAQYGVLKNRLANEFAGEPRHYRLAKRPFIDSAEVVAAEALIKSDPKAPPLILTSSSADYNYPWSPWIPSGGDGPANIQNLGGGHWEAETPEPDLWAYIPDPPNNGISYTNDGNGNQTIQGIVR